MGIGNEIINDVEKVVTEEVIDSKNLFRFTGTNRNSYTNSFESNIKEMFNSHASLLLPSATLALYVFIKSREYKKSSEIITAPFSWVADYSAIKLNSCNIRFYALNDDLQFDIDSIKKLVNKNTVAIIVPHLMGRGQQNIGLLAEFCKDKKIDLIEDIAQSFGVKIEGRYAGTFGDFSFSSFNHHKILSSGDGGVAIINNDNYVKGVMSFHDQGCLIKNGKRFIDTNNNYPGLSLRVNELTASVLLSQLSKFSLIKQLIIEKHEKILNYAKDIVSEVIKINEGDIPYTFLFKEKRIKNYPNLVESGWHFIENISYYSKLDLEKDDINNIKKSKESLNRVYALGTGFIDKYYSIEDGVSFNEDFNKNKLEKIFKKII